MKPTLTNIERRVSNLEAQSGATLEPLVLTVRVVYEPLPGQPNEWDEGRTERIDKDGRRIITILPGCCLPEEIAMKTAK